MNTVWHKSAFPGDSANEGLTKKEYFAIHAPVECFTKWQLIANDIYETQNTKEYWDKNHVLLELKSKAICATRYADELIDALNS